MCGKGRGDYCINTLGSGQEKKKAHQFSEEEFNSGKGLLKIIKENSKEDRYEQYYM